MPPVRSRLGGSVNARNIINARNCEREEVALANPCVWEDCGWRRGSDNDDRSPTHEHRGPRAFGRSIQ
jgi:hypothetical protein